MQNDETVQLRTINLCNRDGLWVTVFDDNGNEVELTIRGLTPERMTAFLAGQSVSVPVKEW